MDLSHATDKISLKRFLDNQTLVTKFEEYQFDCSFFDSMLDIKSNPKTEFIKTTLPMRIYVSCDKYDYIFLKTMEVTLNIPKEYVMVELYVSIIDTEFKFGVNVKHSYTQREHLPYSPPINFGPGFFDIDFYSF